MFIARFIAGNLFCSAFAVLIMLAKKLLGGKMPQKYHYRIWLLLLLALAVAFLPTQFLQLFQHTRPSIEEATTHTVNHTFAISDVHTYTWSMEASDAVSLIDHTHITSVLFIIWGVGMVLTSGLYIKSIFQLVLLRRHAVRAPERVQAILYRCREISGTNNKITLLQSTTAKAPMSFGLLSSCIILPSHVIDEMTDEELEHILLHEIMHIAHRDALLNYLFCIVQALYWCNPIVWIAFSKMRQDREAYCDWSVLNMMSTQEDRLNYGYTLLQFARKKSLRLICTENGLGGSKAQIRYRIERISTFKRQTKKGILCGSSVILIAALLISVQFPVLAAFSDNSDTYVPASGLVIEEVDYSNLFGSSKGCAVLYDTNSSSYIVYNPDKMTERIAPCSTYKIFSALNALEQGIITTDYNTLLWDGTPQPFLTWSSDQTLMSAMRNSVNWYFQHLDAYAGASELSAFYQTIHYGNCKVSSKLENYWNGASLKISPLEQVELLKNLYENMLDCNAENMEAVKQAIFLSDNFGNRLYGKTGTGQTGEVETMGWFVGYVESADNTYFFAVNLQNADGANGNDAAQVVYSIFDSLGITL